MAAIVFSKIKRVLLWLFFTLIALFIIVQIVSRILFAAASHYKDEVTALVSERIHKPVKISWIHATWYGFKPVLKLKNVDILDDTKTKTMAHIDKLFLGVDLFHTLTSRSFKSQDFIVSGLNTDVSTALNLIHQFKDLPPNIQTLLDKTSPAGWIDNINVENHRGKRIVASGHFSNFSIKATNSLPGIDHVSGDFSLRGIHNHLSLKASGSTVDAGSLLREPVNLLKLRAEINWQKTADDFLLEIPVCDIALPTGEIKSHLTMTMQRQDDSPRVDAEADFHFSDISKLKQYFPVGVMTPKFTHWLDNAFVGGRITDGKFLLHGKLGHLPFDDGDGRMIITAHIDGLQLNYKKDWPAINDISADVKFENSSFSMIATHAVVLGQTLTSANANIKDLVHPILHVNAKVDGQLENVLAFVHQSPLEKGLGKQLAPLQLGGPMLLSLHLKIPFKIKNKTVHVLGSVKMHDSNLTIPDWRLSLDKLNGRFKFTNRGINSDELSAELYGQPIAFKLSTVHGSDSSQTNVDFHGVLNDVAVKSIVPIALVRHLEGQSKFTAKLTLHPAKSDETNTFHLQANLQGMEINLPAPLAKRAETVQALDLNIKMKPGTPTLLDLSLSDVLQVAMKMDKKQLKSAHIHFGAEATSLPEKDIMSIDGKIAKFDFAQWMSSLFGKHHKKGAMPAFAHLDLAIDKLFIFGQTIPSVKASLTTQTHAIKIAIRSSKANGDVTIPNDFPKGALDVTVDRFHFYAKNRAAKSQLRPEDLPPMNITVNDFSFEKLPLGRFELSITPEKNSLKINELSFKSKLMSFSASGQWDSYGSYQKTVLSGAMYTHNLGMMLNVFDISNTMVGGDGRALFNLQWGDSLINYEIAKLNGRVNYKFDRGQIVKLSKETAAQVGIGRVLNLFSLQSIPRRLALDFSDLNNDGFSFDELSGHIMLRDGNAYTRDSKMLGSVASVTMHGRLGMKTKDYQLSLAITPHVTSSLPVVATVAGGPVAGVAAWAVEKLFSKAVNQVTTVNYKVTGPWAHPHIEKVQGVRHS